MRFGSHFEHFLAMFYPFSTACQARKYSNFQYYYAFGMKKILQHAENYVNTSVFARSGQKNIVNALIFATRGKKNTLNIVVWGFQGAKHIGIFSESVRKCGNTTYLTIFLGSQKCKKNDVLQEQQEQQEQQQQQQQ